ncbi:MurR/RpiR family transcriptional regulator [Pseudooceanicola aestuarii]|uniref:MurR/RpiR family transcriptional regulator n=1 Tax=Pseudooceanicola aestuarii TaxID=2697319 RepID=UPI0013D6DA4A|nr:MurR/RpiR family transcriptional regulator [Pseudooceanicola aestuarii]
MQVREKIEQLTETFTPAERTLASVLLSDYPFAGLQSIQDLAKTAQSSGPTVSRFVSKLGYSGYQAFQQALIGELKEGQKSPIQLMATQKPFEEAWFAEFMRRAEMLMAEVATTISDAQFTRVCKLLSEPGPGLYMIGGRVSDGLAQYMFRHLRQFRPKVHHLPADPETWPGYVTGMRKSDILLIVDFRRYQVNLERLAAMTSSKRGCRIVLITDKWISPIARHAHEVLAVPIENGTFWDSYAGALSVMEAIMTRVAESDWNQAKQRIEQWDEYRQTLMPPSGPET